MTQPPLIMLCTDKGSMVQAQYCSKWTELWCGMFQGSIHLFRDDRTKFQGSIHLFQDDRTRVVRVYHPLPVFIIVFNVCKADTSGSRLTVPFAVRHHKCLLCQCIVFCSQDLQLNRVVIEETVDMGTPTTGSRPKKKHKSYDLSCTDKFWIKQKGKWVISPGEGGGGHLYSKVDIMPKYKNTERGCFFMERHVPCRPCLGCQKQQKSRKRVCFFFSGW